MAAPQFMFVAISECLQLEVFSDLSIKHLAKTCKAPREHFAAELAVRTEIWLGEEPHLVSNHER